ncbi:MAG: hypothetical protein Q8922_04005 [Bacteroidota bacterium]|nr:hypothetical protein [Bacteroidota bacterium]MDP4233458.1 hypothetical protein [Bacteroidota bacterium]MDP4242324.1 hypothetical protein [Bacteroidota bacterium]MDP4287080.1 hypothetical protein [Bacteroidota bacterium]
MRVFLLCLLSIASVLLVSTVHAQQPNPGTQPSHVTQPSHGTHKQRRPAKPSVRIMPAAVFHPTCNLDSNSVGYFFFPPNLGAEWMMRTISQIMDAHSRVLKSDTTFSFERVISDSNRTLQGLPILRCSSSFPFHAGAQDSAKRKEVEYYLDDSVIVAVMNHSVSNGLSHILLVNPLRVGASWRDDADDTIRTKVISLDEPVTTSLGTFPHSLVVQSRVGFGELSKYFVKGVGIVKTVYRGLSPRENGSFVVTTELVRLDAGDPKRSIKFRFPKLVAKPIAVPKTKSRKK